MLAGARIAFLTMLAPLLVTGLAAAQPVAAQSERAQPVDTVAGTGAVPGGPPAVDSFRSVRSYPSLARPVRIRIPAARVDSPLDRLGRAADGSIADPERAGVAGWYAEGPRPGEPGPAVILGHVDSRTGPGVFFAVHRLPRGAAVHVDRADGSTATFRVDRIARVPKNRFPTDQVYLPTLQPALHLVTCGGVFDQRRGSYRDNVIVFAVPA